jgi:3-hydroxybutyryl-CoA dehydratase
MKRKMEDKIKQFHIGQEASMSKTFTTKDVEAFSLLSQDINPIHISDEYAKNSIFGNKIVHGFLVGSLISAVIANKLPGKGSIYLFQDLAFKNPVFHGENIVAKVIITNIKFDKSIVYLDTFCVKENNIVVIEGKAVIKVI